MLNELVKKNNISVYKLSNDTGIPYSTLCDLISGKTLIEKTSAHTLYHLAQYFKISMESLYLSQMPRSILYLYNSGRNVYIEYSEHTIQYSGPKNLIAFKRINRITEQTLYVECYFVGENSEIFTEEDYIDLKSLFDEYGYLFEIDENTDIRIGHPSSGQILNIIDNSIVVSDNIAISISDNSTTDIVLDIVSINRPTQRMTLRLKDYLILSTNMSASMSRRAIASVKRNLPLINNETGGANYA